jgi:hypothetical protein
VSAEGAESDGAQRILSWAYLVGFVILTSVGRGVVYAAGQEDSAGFQILNSAGFASLVWVWLVSQLRPHRATYPLDFGLFVLSAWLVVAPVFLWRFERWRGLGKCALVLVLYPLGYALTLAVFFALRGLLALRGDG